MKGTKALSFLLVFALLASLVVPGFFALPAKAEDTDNGMRISKTATNNEDGTYTIKLEAYATGSKIISEVKTDIPTDIVLVLDRSGSMKENMNTYSFQPYSNKNNSDYYALRHNGGSSNLYFKLEDGGYASVSVERTPLSSEDDYVECSGWTNSNYLQHDGTLYSKVGDGYKEVTVSYDYQNYQYVYTFYDGSKITSRWSTSNPDFKGKGPLYYLDTVNNYSYTYSYTDQDSVLHEIGASVGNDSAPEFTLYERSTGTITRMQALKNAALNFVNSVSDKAKGEDKTDPKDDVQHRLAVVSYASESTNHTGGLLDMTVDGNVTTATNAINNLTANGGTLIDSGISTANSIFASNPISADDTSGRQRVMIVFTDGAPGLYGDWEDDSRSTANNAVSNANTTKNTYGATVYTIGIFSGANASNPGSLPAYSTNRLNDSKEIDNSNRFMHLVSSNYPNATSMTNTGALNPNLIGSYYLSASDAGTLDNIFRQIANNIESGGSSTTLDEKTDIKDIISPQFTLPAGATANDITLETYRYTDENQWTKNSDAMGATAVVNGDQVSVTGFDFSDNWCGTVNNNGKTEYRGNKLVISFKVQTKTGFLGGNGVPTNTSAGVYQDTSATDPVMYFPQPKVDIPINDVTVDAQDKNVYLLQDVPVSSLTNGTTIQVGDVSLDLTKENYGLESWQNEYVNITVEVKDKNGTVISNSLSGLTADETYTVSVTVSPKTAGTATAKTGNDTAKINVFKPVLTYQDSEVYYGASAPAGYTSNLVSTSWMHGTTVADSTTMGAAPALTPQYTPGTGVVNGTIATKQDIPVNVTVSMGGIDVTQYVDFRHNNCDGKNCAVPSGSEFLLHVKTCQLTITKEGGDGSEPYVFDVYKDGTKYSEVSIMGNGTATIVELPVGCYTIKEDTGWSWRYSGNNGSAAELSAETSSGSIICTNTKTQNYWLNGFSDVVANIFGVPKASN